MAQRVGPVQRGCIRRPGQSVSRSGINCLDLQDGRAVVSGVQAKKLGAVGIAWLVDRAGPKPAQRIGLAVVKARGGWVVQCGCQQFKVAVPLPGAVNAGAQGDDQAGTLAASASWRDAPRLGRQRPALNVTSQNLCPADLAGRNVHPVKALLVWVPKRRFSQLAGLRDSNLPGHWKFLLKRQTFLSSWPNNPIQSTTGLTPIGLSTMYFGQVSGFRCKAPAPRIASLMSYMIISACPTKLNEPL